MWYFTYTHRLTHTSSHWIKKQILLHYVAAFLLPYSRNCLQFVAAGGLQQLLEIFNSGILEPKEQESWTVVSENSPFQPVTVADCHFYKPNPWTTCKCYFCCKLYCSKGVWSTVEINLRKNKESGELIMQ